MDIRSPPSRVTSPLTVRMRFPSSAEMRACSCANSAATASSVLISSCFHLRAPFLTKPSTPVVVSPETSGAAATDGEVGRLDPPSQRCNALLLCSGRITTGFLPCSQWASTGSAFVL